MNRFLATAFASVVAFAVLAVFPAAAHAELEYSVPGVINDGAFATVFLCANHSVTNNLGLQIQLYDATGATVGTTNIAMPTLGSVTVATQGTGTLPITQNMNLGFFQGSAKLVYDGKGIVCTAWVLSPSTSAGYVNSLPLIFKAKQK